MCVCVEIFSGEWCGRVQSECVCVCVCEGKGLQLFCLSMTT